MLVRHSTAVIIVVLVLIIIIIVLIVVLVVTTASHTSFTCFKADSQAGNIHTHIVIHRCLLRTIHIGVSLNLETLSSVSASNFHIVQIIVVVILLALKVGHGLTINLVFIAIIFIFLLYLFHVSPNEVLHAHLVCTHLISLALIMILIVQRIYNGISVFRFDTRHGINGGLRPVMTILEIEKAVVVLLILVLVFSGPNSTRHSGEHSQGDHKKMTEIHYCSDQEVLRDFRY
mmetsp:Transcript_3403/g.6417  ORF Transcript_3403/g.6417 Transcript_3403/m.6417 type:complete len:231 (+) Transcript_3403:421-1113(+)